MGTQGRKTRRKRERQEKVSVVSHGHTATHLYLQSYQLILWKQCHALIHTIGLPSELETVVKDLWALRLQLVKQKAGDATSDGTIVFSSQPVSDAGTDNNEESIGRKWKVRGKGMPTLIETLGLLYFGIVLLRLPVSMGEIHRYDDENLNTGERSNAAHSWAIREDIPYIRAVRFIPAVMKHKLPAEYLLALDTTVLLSLAYTAVN